MRKELWALAERASSHHGVASTSAAAELGLSRRQLHRAAASGIVEFVHPHVIRFRGGSPSPAQMVAAAVLQVPDSAASHESSLCLHRVPRTPFCVAVTTSPSGPSSRWGIRIHRAGDLLPEHVTVVGGVAVTTLPRAVVDLSSVFGAARLAHLVDHLTISDRRTSVGSIARVLRQVNRRGRRGIGVLQQLLEERSAGGPAPRSRTERRVDRLLATSAALPEPIRERGLPGPELAGLVDRAWEDARLILEVDGRVWHAREQAMASDRSRDRAAAAAGWQTMRVLDEELDSDGAAVLRDVEAAYSARIKLLTAFLH